MALESGQEGANKEAPKEGNLSNDQLQKLVLQLSQQVNELKNSNKPASFPVNQGMSADDVAKIVGAMRDQNDIDYESGITSEQVPVDDYDEKGVRFCAPFLGYVIIDDTRNGYRVRLPFGKKKVFFEYQATRKYQQGKFQAIAPFSAYTSHSKKEIEWMRAHSGYGIFFYESANDATNSDLRKIQELSKIMTVLTNYELHDLNKRAKEYGIDFSDNPQEMRVKIAYKMLEKKMGEEDDKTKSVLNESFKNALFAGKV